MRKSNIEATNKRKQDNKRIKNNEKKKKFPSGISQREDGRYLVRMQGSGLKLSKYTWELEEALRIREDFIRSIEAHKVDENSIKNNNVKLSEKKLNEIFKLSMSRDNKLKPSTRSTYEQYWKCYLEKSFLSKMVVKDIKRKDVKNAYEEILYTRDKLLSAGTFTIINIIVKRCVDYVNFEEETCFNPTKGVLSLFKLPKAKEKRIIAEAEIKLLIEFMINERFSKYVNIFKFMILSGSRIGETLALTWDDIDLTENVYSIRKNMNYRKLDVDGKYVLYVSSLKTDRSLRTNPMNQELRETLLNEKKRQQDNNIVCSEKVDYLDDRGVKKGKIGNFVFLNAEGKPYREETIRTAFKRVVRNCNEWEVKRSIEEGREPRKVNEFTPHATRHTTITNMVNSGANLKVVQRIVGHADIKTTIGTYYHVSEAEIVKVINQTQLIN